MSVITRAKGKIFVRAKNLVAKNAQKKSRGAQRKVRIRACAVRLKIVISWINRDCQCIHGQKVGAHANRCPLVLLQHYCEVNREFVVKKQKPVLGVSNI